MSLPSTANLPSYIVSSAHPRATFPVDLHAILDELDVL